MRLSKIKINIPDFKYDLERYIEFVSDFLRNKKKYISVILFTTIII